MAVILRTYQQEAIESVWRYWREGKRHPLIEMATGSGKSLVLASLAWRIRDGGGRVIVATHRKELIEQDAAAILRIRPEGRREVGIYSSGLGRREVRPITVGGVQSIFRRCKELGHRDVVIIDEAHLVGPKGDTQYGKLIAGLRDTNPDLRLCGLSATPYRLGQGLLTEGDGALFTSIVYKTDIKSLIADGYLSPLVSGSATAAIDTSQARTSAGDWVLADLELAADVDSINDAVARDIYTSQRQHVLVFGVSVAHTMRLRNAIRMAGISCEAVTGDTPPDQRRRLLEDFKAGGLQCITSCDVLTTGFDAPLTDCVVLCRPTQSCSLYVQMVGRGSRLAAGKRDCLVLDYGGNIARHGPLDSLKAPQPKTGKGGGQAPYKLCPQCMAQNPAMARVCSECDYEFPPHARKANEQASKLQVISTKPKVEPIEQRIDEVRWSDHTSKNSGKRMLRVDYFGPGSSSQWHPVATDWVCIEHDGYARQKAEEWWAVHLAGRGPCPSTVDAAMRMEEWKRPVEAIWTVPDGKYQKITKYRFGRMRQPGEDDDEPEDGQQEQTEQPTDGGWDDDDFLPF